MFAGYRCLRQNRSFILAIKHQREKTRTKTWQKKFKKTPLDKQIFSQLSQFMPNIFSIYVWSKLKVRMIQFAAFSQSPYCCASHVLVINSTYKNFVAIASNNVYFGKNIRTLSVEINWQFICFMDFGTSLVRCSNFNNKLERLWAGSICQSQTFHHSLVK